MAEETRLVRVSTEYGNGVVSHSNETHYWILLDKPIKFSDQFLNSIPIKKSEVKIIKSKFLKNYESNIDEDFMGYI